LSQTISPFLMLAGSSSRETVKPRLRLVSELCQFTYHSQASPVSSASGAEPQAGERLVVIA